MSDFTELRDDIAAIGTAMDAYSSTAVRNLLEQSRQIDRLWADNAELRDELHAVANRLENLTRAVTTDPAEVAQAIVNDANRSTRRCDGIDHVWHDSRARFGEWCDCGTARYGEQYLTDDQVAELRAKRQA